MNSLSGKDKKPLLRAVPTAPRLEEEPFTPKAVTETGGSAAAIDRREVFTLLQGEVQDFISHQILIAAWGDFSRGDLKIDVLSSLPVARSGKDRCGVRIDDTQICGVDCLVKELFGRWLAGGRNPMLIDGATRRQPSHSHCISALLDALRSSWSMLVHGTQDQRDGCYSLYLFLNRGPMTNGRSVDGLRVVADAVVAQLDTGFQAVPALRRADIAVHRLGAACLDQAPLLNERTESNVVSIFGINCPAEKKRMQRITSVRLSFEQRLVKLS